MVNKIGVIGKWNAHAALHSAIENSKPEDGIFIVVLKRDNKDGDTIKHFSANLSHADMVYLMEEAKFSIFNEE